MGQHQSSQTADGQSKVSYYELLSVTRTASDDEIKKAYRQKALELHPDRNYGNVEEATARFAEVQTAYEVLSDPQERAWYDSHENAILSGAGQADYAESVAVTTSEDIAKLFAGFSGRNDFTDSPNGFFSSLRDVFSNLDKEEAIASDYIDVDPIDYPSFGSMADNYLDVVKPFYDTWSNFSTRKNFAWKDIYRLSEAPDRRVRRAMEKENKRLRDEAIKDFNYTIKTLVAFVRKRDPRYRSNIQSEAERQQTLREQTSAQAAKARAENNAKIKSQAVPEWVGPQDGGAETAEDHWEEKHKDSSQVFECVVCEKFFKTEKQYEAHERSKKHTQAVKALQKQMRKEGVLFDTIPIPQETSEHDTQDQKASPISPATNAVHQKSSRKSNISKDDSSSESGSSIGEQQQQRNSEIRASSEDNETISPENADESSVSDDDEEAIVSRENGVEGTEEADDDNDDDDEDYAPRHVVSERLAGMSLTSDAGDDDDSNLTDSRKLGKAKQKREKKAARQAQVSNTNTNTNTNTSQDVRCVTCNRVFDSRTQLFSHLRQQPSHARIQKSIPNKNKKRK